MVLDNFVRKAIVGEEGLLSTESRRGSVSTACSEEAGNADRPCCRLRGPSTLGPGWPEARHSGVEADRWGAFGPGYASMMCGDDIEGGLRTPEDYGGFADASLVAAGYQAIKIHTWMPPVPFAPDPGNGRPGLRRRARSGRSRHTVDARRGHWYSRVDALKLGQALQALDFYWYEEPMEEASISSYRWLADQLDIPIVGPESAAGRVHTRGEWVRAGACDILRVGANDTGGITPALKIIHLAEAFNMQAEVHEGGSGNLALLGAMSNGRWYERGLLHPHFDDEAMPHLNSIIDPIDAAGEIPMCALSRSGRRSVLEPHQ